MASTASGPAHIAVLEANNGIPQQQQQQQQWQRRLKRGDKHLLHRSCWLHQLQLGLICCTSYLLEAEQAGPVWGLGPDDALPVQLL